MDSNLFYRNSMTFSGNFGKIDPRFILTFFEIARNEMRTSGYLAQITLKVILLLTQIALLI